MLWNQLQIAGRLGRDPEMSYTPQGKAVTKFSIAVNQGQDNQGQNKPAMWLNIVAWEQLAEKVNEKFRKGNEVFVQGKLAMRTYDDKNGEKRTAFDIVASTAQLLEKPEKTAAATNAANDYLGELEDHPF